MAKKNTGGKKKDLTYSRSNGYEKISPAELKKLDEISKAYMSYLGASKTEREAHDEAVNLLQNAGFKDLDIMTMENKPLKSGDKIYRSCAGKTLMAAVIGRHPLEKGMRIVGGHTDAPRIDVKQNPLYEKGEMALFDTHYYGGIKKYQWVALPLALHGVFVKPDGRKITLSIGEKPQEPVFCISDLLPHMAQDQMKKTLSEGIPGESLDVIVGSVPVKDKKRKEKIKYQVLELLKEKYGVSEADFLSAELEFVPAGLPRETGFDRSMILGYGHDDRVCAWAALRAMLDTCRAGAVPEYTSCVILCDKEEIGSLGPTGMQSNFFENTAAEMVNLASEKYSGLTLKRMLANSKMLSADVNALFDPLHPSVSEKKNAAFLNQGVCLTKFCGRGGKSGANDANAEFVAEVRRIFDKAGVVWQAAEIGKVDQGGGGTIAAFMARYGMNVIDCGVGILSMHAPWELAGKFDIYMAYKGYLAFMINGSCSIAVPHEGKRGNEA